MTSTPLHRWLSPRGDKRKTLYSLMHTRALTVGIFGDELHLARVRSLANAVTGMLNATVASVAAIGRAYAAAAGIESKSGVTQVDRLLSSDGIALREVLPLWIRHVIGETPKIVVAMDWTDFDDDDHTTLCVSLITTHGRATPLAWKTVTKSKLAKRRTGYELKMVKDLHEWLPSHVRVEWLADRAFGYHELYELLGSYNSDYTIRFRENIKIYEGENGCLPASAYVPANGRAQAHRSTGHAPTLRGACCGLRQTQGG